MPSFLNQSTQQPGIWAWNVEELAEGVSSPKSLMEVHVSGWINVNELLRQEGVDPELIFGEEVHYYPVCVLCNVSIKQGGRKGVFVDVANAYIPPERQIEPGEKAIFNQTFMPVYREGEGVRVNNRARNALSRDVLDSEVVIERMREIGMIELLTNGEDND